MALGLGLGLSRGQYGGGASGLGILGGSSAYWRFNQNQSLTSQIGSVTLTHTRASTSGAFVGSNGLLQTVGTNSAVFEYDPVTLVCKGLRIEAAATNLLLQSQVRGTTWTNTDTTITSNDTTAPDGTATADLLTEGTAGTAESLQAVTITAGHSITYSDFFKRGNHDWVRMAVTDGTDIVQAWFNLATGAVGTGNDSGATPTYQAHGIEAMPNGFYRCYVTGIVDGSSTSITCTSHSADADASTTRVNNATRYEWGAQAEAIATRSTMTSYIATTTATVTRAAENVTGVTSGISGFNPAEGTLYGKAIGSSFNSGRYLVQLKDGANNTFVDINASNNNPLLACFVGGVSSANVDAGTWANSATAKVAGAWKLDDFAVSINGVAAVTDTSGAVPSALGDLRVGMNHNGNQWNSHISELAIFTRRLTNAELRAITT